MICPYKVLKTAITDNSGPFIQEHWFKVAASLLLGCRGLSCFFINLWFNEYLRRYHLGGKFCPIVLIFLILGFVEALTALISDEIEEHLETHLIHYVINYNQYKDENEDRRYS